KVIEYFQKNYGVSLIGLEGANSQLDPQIFKSFPNKTLLHQVFEDYFNKGELTGGTAAAIFSNLPAVFHGVEDWELYEQGLGLYLASMKEDGKLNEKLSKWKDNLAARKKDSYSEKLLQVDQKLNAFQNNEVNLIELIQL